MFNLKIIKRYKNLNFHTTPPSWVVKLMVNIRAKIRDKQGATTNPLLTTMPNMVNPLPNNLTTSAKGCNSPNLPTFIGPTRTWLNLNNLRSNSVKKATLTKTGNTVARIHSISIARLKIALKFSFKAST